MVDDQVRFEVLPELIALGLALIATVGAGVDTVIVAACVALPPGPAQVRA